MISKLLPALVLLATTGELPPIVGTWHGTSICVDKVAHPACNDEVAHYVIRPKGSSRDTVVVRAGKIVNGAFEEVSTDDFIHQPDGSWKTEIARYRVRIVLRVSGDSLTGSLVDMANSKKARNIALRRVSR